MIKQSDLGLSAVTDNIQNIQGKICVQNWLIMCVLLFPDCYWESWESWEFEVAV